jgi:hypothetical protein
MTGYHALEGDFSQQNALLLLTLGALALRERFFRLLDEAAPPAGAERSVDEEPGLHFVLGLVALAERIGAHAESTSPLVAPPDPPAREGMIGSLLR